MDFLDNIKIGRKLIGAFLIVSVIISLVAVFGFLNMKTINDGMTSMYVDRLVPLDNIGHADSAFYRFRGDVLYYIAAPTERTKLRSIMEDLIAEIHSDIKEYRASNLLKSEEDELAKFDSAWAQYQKLANQALDDVDAGKEKEVISSIIDGEIYKARTDVVNALDALGTINTEEAKRINTEADATFAASTLAMTLISIIGVVIALFMGIIITRSLTTPLARAVEMFQEMGKGHLSDRLKMNRKDEIGVLAQTLDAFSEKLQTHLVGTLHKIAQGEKDIALLPAADEQDEISPAVNQTITTINNIVGEVGYLIAESQEGNLKKRGDPTKYIGAYRDIIVGINNMLDAIVTPINEALRVSDLFAHAKFTTRFDENVVTKGDLIALKEGLNTVGRELSVAIQDVSEQIGSLTSSAEEAAASVEEITAGASSVAQSSAVVSYNAENSVTSVDQVLTAMEELTSSVSTVAAKVDAVSRLTQDANTTSTKGVEQAAVAETGINAINQSVNDVGTIITEIREQMNEIGKIVEIISNIADQTNLLALNAAIEAARAGDAGMGFAVVANEVKTLAQDSQGSAENIAKIISSLQRQSEKAATAMNQATTEVDKGSVAITDTIRFFNAIAEQIEEIANNMTEVASLSEEEAAAVEEITASVSEVRIMSNDTAREAGNSAAASEQSSAALNQVSQIISDLSVIATRINDSMSRLNG